MYVCVLGVMERPCGYKVKSVEASHCSANEGQIVRHLHKVMEQIFASLGSLKSRRLKTSIRVGKSASRQRLA